MADATDVNVQSAPAPEADQKKAEIAERLMAEAKTHVEEKERLKPTPPKAPLREGLYRFPLYLSSVGVWIVMSVGFTICFALLVTVVELISAGGIASILCAFLAPMLAICTFAMLGLVTPQLLNIVEYTAEGYDQIPFWPSQDMLSRIHAVFVWVNALAMSVAPGVILVSLIRMTGVPVPTWLGLLTVVVLLPPVLLSMLLNGSMFAPYSAEVFGSFRSARPAWVSILVQMVAVAVATIAATYLVHRIQPGVSNYFAIIVTSIYWVFYSRLVGRMGWIISQIDQASDVDDDTEGEPEIGSPQMGEHDIFREEPA